MVHFAAESERGLESCQNLEVSLLHGSETAWKNVVKFYKTKVQFSLKQKILQIFKSMSTQIFMMCWFEISGYFWMPYWRSVYVYQLLNGPMNQNTSLLYWLNLKKNNLQLSMFFWRNNQERQKKKLIIDEIFGHTAKPWLALWLLWLLLNCRCGREVFQDRLLLSKPIFKKGFLIWTCILHRGPDLQKVKIYYKRQNC